MAAKFEIWSENPNYIENDPDMFFTWALYGKDGELLAQTLSRFASEKECRSNIADVKKAAQKFTKVEVQDA